MISRNKLAKLATIEIFCLPEHEGPEGSFAMGDDAEDAKICAEIRERMEWNDWAWCVVRVVATFAGQSGDDYLGGCSYDSEADFCAAGGYYPQMVESALDDLMFRLTEAEKELSRVAL